ncbi:MAG: hypothetical protein AAGD10_12285 [Myxococcota bacterium]
MRRLWLTCLAGVGCSVPSSDPAVPEPVGALVEPAAYLPAADYRDAPFDWSRCSEVWPWPWSEARMSKAHVDGSVKGRLVQDEFELAAVSALRARPASAACADRAFGAEGPAGRIRAAAAALGQPVDFRSEASGPGLVALEVLCQGACVVEGRGLDVFAQALAPVLWALVDAAGLLSMYEEPVRGGDWWSAHGGNGLLGDPSSGMHYNAAAPSDRAFMSLDKGAIYGVAVHLAYAIERVDWSALEGVEQLRVETPLGPMGVAGFEDDRHEEDWLLLIDRGGRDLHLHSAGGTGPGRPLAVTIDLGGDDLYAYPEWSGDEGRMAGDGADRFDLLPQIRQASGSDKGRQGAAWFGIGFLFDLGGDDRYRSLRGSQGYGQHGVGMLYDAEGDDSYRAEVASQGTGQYGLGLLLDDEGDDLFEALGKSQGHGFVGGLGGLFDRGGDDRYVCESDSPLVYPSAQLPEEEGVSLCQGAGFGFRSDLAAYALSGGMGILWDEAGNDSYRAEVYAQGVGYWQGVGLLRDEAGDDVYTAAYYGMGSGVHYGLGILHDRSGRDAYGGDPTLAAGTGHDYGLGVVYDEAGDDAWQPGSASLGVGSCGGLGVAVDARGNDVYAPGSGSLGRARAGRCPEDQTMGFFLDGDGQDAYPAGEARQGARWGGDQEPLVGLGEDVSP